MVVVLVIVKTLRLHVEIEKICFMHVCVYVGWLPGSMLRGWPEKGDE